MECPCWAVFMYAAMHLPLHKGRLLTLLPEEAAAHTHTQLSVLLQERASSQAVCATPAGAALLLPLLVQGLAVPSPHAATL